MSAHAARGIQRLSLFGCLIAALLLTTHLATGFQVRQEQGRFDLLVIYDPANISPATMPVEELDAASMLRAGWVEFKRSYGQGWKIYLDGRSGAPLLVEGQGIAIVPGAGNSMVSPSKVTIEYLESSLRKFMEQQKAILLARGDELVLNRDASLQVTPELWQVVFDRKVNGIPVAGDQYIFRIGNGNLISFGASRWCRISTDPVPSLSSGPALQKLLMYMGISANDSIEFLDTGKLFYLPLTSSGLAHSEYKGEIGGGYGSALIWKFVMRVSGEPGTWIGVVDAHGGEILALYDDDKYAQVKGGIYPESSDQICPSGCEQPNYPMPFTDITIDGIQQTATSMGMFECSPYGYPAITTLSGQYIYVQDNCGPVSQSATCDDDLDLGTSMGADCAVPSGSSAGNTHAARSSFYHLNRAKEMARFWLPYNYWLSAKLTDYVNLDSTCNAGWDGAVNFFKSGDGCNNTGEVTGVVIHEWGHGLDQNDGGGYDNPSEAYADTSEFIYDHTSCIGRGFWQSSQCSGYGNACLDCTGVREMDWDKRADHLPSTAANWSDNCQSGGAPCGTAQHCEGHIAGETMWDLAVRDLPAAGYDQATAWQITDRLWYKSRVGSGSVAYNCSPPNSDGCGTYTWFTKLRNIDDDNGNLNDGTPHAAAIFAAFSRHNIACGGANDASNKNYTTCPSIGGTTLTAAGGLGSVSLSWTPVADASTYYVLRNDIGCGHSNAVIATVTAPATTYSDPNLPYDFPLYYRIQPVGSNSSCTGSVSNCVNATPQPYAGSIKLDRSLYSCNDTVVIIVRDSNVGASTVTVKIWSTTESTPENVVLTETPAGSSKFIGTINTTPDPPASDGLLSLANGDSLTAEYVDIDDGMGGHDIARRTIAPAECIFPVISNVLSKDVTDTRATVTWWTDEASDTVLTWGPSKPPVNQNSSTTMAMYHVIQLADLQPCTIYYYQVSSADLAKNRAVDDNAGRFYSFETYGNFGSGLQQCHQGRVTVLEDTYTCSSDVVSFEVIDLDLNFDPNVIDQGTIPVTSTTENTPELVTLTETGPYTSRFTGSILTAKGTPAADGMLQGNDDDVVTVTYLDANDGNGAAKVVYDTAVMDCGGPAISNLQVSDITDQRFTISFNTDEPGSTVVDWGATPALGNTVTQSALTTSHTVLLNKLNLCEPFYFRVSSGDAHGNVAVGDMNGQAHRAHTWTIPGLYWQETFEGNTSEWTMNGEWQIGTPQGLGGAYGNPDPNGAYNNSKSLGDDLTGMGTYPGDYEHHVTEEATSPILKASSWSNTKLIIHRQLNIQRHDNASLSVFVGNTETEIFDSNYQDINESAFSNVSYDVASLVDGEKSVKLKFHVNSDWQQTPYDDGISSGWNVDDIIFKDGTLPDYAQCGGCGLAPSFSGAKSAVDNNACGATGVTVSWNAAVSWGTGSNGTYAIYRDTVPNFTPSAANRIASVTGTSYNDLSSPTDRMLYYLVRAENNETCSSGPNNGGVMDANTVYAAVSETTSWQIPDEVTTLRAEMVNRAHLRLSWQAATGAATYRIYRATAPNGTFTLIAETGSLFYDDLNQGGNAASYYYKVRAVSPCSQEGP